MKVIRVILVIINVIAALGLVLTTTAGWVAPSRSAVPSLLAFAYLPMLMLNVLIVVMWLLMKRWEALISIAAIAVRWSMVGMYIQVGGTAKQPDREQHPQMVSLMTYNVHQFRGSEVEGTASDEYAGEFIDMVRREGPDVLCLQEFCHTKHQNVTDSLVLMGYNHYHGSHTAKRGAPYGTVVFSRHPITFVKNIDSEKVLVELMLNSGGRMRVCNLHMDSYSFDNSDREKIEQMRKGEVDSTSRRTLKKVKETILNHEEEWQHRIKPLVVESSMPMVVAGDLNDIPSSWLYSQMSTHLHDTFCDEGNGLSITYNGGFPNFRIDMVFRSDGIRTLSYRRPKSDLSDHYPVLATMELEI